MKINRSLLFAVSTAITLPLFAKQAVSDIPEGQALFNRHGCTNCHGQNGVHPESRHVPILRGKSTDYLYAQATKIFGGGTISEKSVFMHDQFCIGEEPEEGCYPPPSDTALKSITEWLGDSELSNKKTTPQQLYLSSTQAFEKKRLLGDKALLIDIRSRAEVTFLGMPTIADASIPYMNAGDYEEFDEKKKTFKLVPNSAFAMKVEELVTAKNLSKETPIILLCRSGNRSAKAAKMLGLIGYTQAYTVTDGYEGDKVKDGANKGGRLLNGWKNAGLPWSYKLDKEKLYWDLF